MVMSDQFVTPSAEESLKLAMTEIQKNRLRDIMREVLRRFAIDALRALTGRVDLSENEDKWLDQEASLCLDRMLATCSPEMWGALSEPVMERRTAEHLYQLAMTALGARNFLMSGPTPDQPRPEPI
jgi:hypothetical protein